MKGNICGSIIGMMSIFITSPILPVYGIDEMITYKSLDSNNNKDCIYKFQYPSDLILSPKLVKTHQEELYYKSKGIKGFNTGLTVDPVKINSLKEFGTYNELANKLLTIEKAKEGMFDAAIISSSESKDSSNTPYPVYDIEYKIDSSRGKKHYYVKATIVDKRLYVFTVQANEDTLDDINIKNTAISIKDSFVVYPSSSSPSYK